MATLQESAPNTPDANCNQEPQMEHSLYCFDLPTDPVPEIGTVLVTGATGYIGGRLVPELLARGYRVRVMVRGDSDLVRQRWPAAEVVEADALAIKTLRRLLTGVHTVYYLIHSMQLGPARFETADKLAAANFRSMAASCGVKRLIYLGGLGDTAGELSPHLASRLEVAQELQDGPVPVTILRAAAIIGSGSASYEIMKHLVQNTPILLLPRWARSRCQPIAVRDVIKYLVGVLETPATSGNCYDIGGVNVMTYRDSLKQLARYLALRRSIISTPIGNISFFSYLASFLTPVPAQMIMCLMEGLRNEVVCQSKEIKYLIPFEPLTYRESCLRALASEESDYVTTRWSDAYPPAHELAVKLHELVETPRYTSAYHLDTARSAATLFRSLTRIGGREGWFHGNWMWRLRGLVDRMLLGVGTSRGRKMALTLTGGDVIDFWRVEDLKVDQRLLLRAEMKLPGQAWLEFTITPITTGNRLHIQAYYQTRTFWGKVYWYIFLPFHHFIFNNLIKQIELRS